MLPWHQKGALGRKGFSWLVKDHQQQMTFVKITFVYDMKYEIQICEILI